MFCFDVKLLLVWPAIASHFRYFLCNWWYIQWSLLVCLKALIKIKWSSVEACTCVCFCQGSLSTMVLCNWHRSHHSKTHRSLIRALHGQGHSFLWNSLPIDVLISCIWFFAVNHMIFYWLWRFIVSILAALTIWTSFPASNFWMTKCIHYLIKITLLFMSNWIFWNFIMCRMHNISAFKFCCTFLISFLIDWIICLLSLVYC